jgi:hypothetical protein
MYTQKIPRSIEFVDAAITICLSQIGLISREVVNSAFIKYPLRYKYIGSIGEVVIQAKDHENCIVHVSGPPFPAEINQQAYVFHKLLSGEYYATDQIGPGKKPYPKSLTNIIGMIAEWRVESLFKSNKSNKYPTWAETEKPDLDWLFQQRTSAFQYILANLKATLLEFENGIDGKSDAEQVLPSPQELGPQSDQQIQDDEDNSWWEEKVIVENDKKIIRLWRAKESGKNIKTLCGIDQPYKKIYELRKKYGYDIVPYRSK